MRNISIGIALLMVVAGIYLHDTTQQPAYGGGCSVAAGQPNGVCVGTDVAISCGTCNMWYPQDGKAWSNAATRGTVPGGWTPVYTPVPCYTVTPCLGGATSPIKTCPIIGKLCTPHIDSCTDYAAGAPVVTTYSTVTNGTCTEG